MDKIAHVSEMMLSAQTYLEKASLGVTKLSDEFYKGAQDDTWLQFSSFIEGLQFLFHLYEAVRTLPDESQLSSYFQSVEHIFLTLQDQTVLLEEAVKNNDFIVLADILKYEIAPNYELLTEITKRTIENEGIIQ